MNDVNQYEAVIGLEVHAQLLTKSKMFCSCPNLFGKEPNSSICPVCSGQPGSLPVINKYAIELGVRAAIVLNCQIQTESIFARKNYFYPDLPKNYQISQYEQPFALDGFLIVPLNEGEKKVGIQRVHFEEDAGKSVHSSSETLINLNRAGVPLVEIVSHPDMRTPHEAGQYLRTLRNLLRFSEVCDGNMEQGNFRCDANISVRLKGASTFGIRVELKNINSFKFVEEAIRFEVERQVESLERGEKITQETRSWNSQKGYSEVMRTKEEAHDYRYFPEPDLPTLIIPKKWQEEIKQNIPELSDAMKTRFMSQYGLSPYDGGVLTSSRELARFFEGLVSLSKNSKLSANWVMNELLGRLNALCLEIENSPISKENLSQLIRTIDSGEISGKMAKDIFDEMFKTGKSCGVIIKEKGLSQISDTGQLNAIIQKIIQNNPEQREDYRKGKVKLIGFFVGLVMKETKGQGNPSVVNDLLKKALDKKE